MGDLPFAKVSDIRFPGNESGITTAANYVSHSQARMLRARLIPAGSVVFPKVGAALLGNARSLTRRDCLIDNNMMAVVPHNGDPRFWLYLLSVVDLGELSPGGPLPYVSEAQVRDLRVSLPSNDEQRRVADFLQAETSKLDELTHRMDRLRELLIHRRQVAIHNYVSGLCQGVEVAQSDLCWAPRIPLHWQAVRLSHLAVMGSGHTPSRSHPEWWENCTIPWITTGEVSQVRDDRREVITETREKISAIGLANSAAELHRAGTVVLCRTASAGYSAVMGVDMATSQDFATWTCGPKLDPYYLLWCLRAMRPDLLGRLAMGSTHKTIYVPDLQMLKVPLPSLREQQQIVQRIRENNALVDAAIDAIDRQLALLAERRHALVAEAVAGQIDVAPTLGLSP
ncbi:restriction endonuclease subunit S [Micromonospora chalcea]|uniref:restriction endonuclease subunit S n=1 Tax=Micromonospora chalcea TaxID=1874 RepID=UPI00340CEC8E